jgi:ketosteroid isomerase-like protein
MKRAAVCLVLASMWPLACVPTPVPDLEAERDAVLQADRDFARAVAERGVEAWVSHFSDDGVMLEAAGEVRGHAAIHELMAPAFESPGFAMTWTPAFAAVSQGGDLAYTYGTYETTAPDAEGALGTTHGRYVTIWRKQTDGTWKVVFDMGNTEPEGQE